MRYKNTLLFKGALGRSVALHLVIITLVLVNVGFKNPENRKLVLPVQAEVQPIQAVAITEEDLQKELNRLDKIEKDKLAEQRRLLAEQKRIKAEQERLKREAEAEIKRLAELKKQQEEAKLKLAEEQKKAEEVKQERLAAEAVEKARQEELRKKQEAEQARVKQLAEIEAAMEADIQAALEAERLAILAAEQAAQNQIILREVDRYKLMVQQAIMRHWLIQGTPPKDATTRLSVRLSPNGTVLKVDLKSSSGNVALDRSAIAAVHKASPLPVPTDPDVFKSFRELTLILRPDSIVSEG